VLDVEPTGQLAWPLITGEVAKTALTLKNLRRQCLRNEDRYSYGLD